MINWNHIRYFKIEEFDSPDAPGSGDEMDYEFVRMLDLVRLFYKKPMIVNSGYRTKAHNRKVKGSKSSSHMKGKAADIRWNTSNDLYRLITCSTSVGFSRIGISFKKKFIHLDNDKEKSYNIIWGYD